MRSMEARIPVHAFQAVMARKTWLSLIFATLSAIVGVFE